MNTRGLRPERYLLSIGVTCIRDGRYAELVSPASVRQMVVTNLRNRPLSPSHVDSMRDLILSFYHDLVTGSKEFPHIAFRGYFHWLQLETPFTPVVESQRENTVPSPLTNLPAGLMVPPVGPRFHSRILTPLLPEKADISVLKADRRNFVFTLDVNGVTVTRVISAVYQTEDIEMTNRWRVTDYSPDGRIIMSVLCRFMKRFAQGAKRKSTEEDSSSTIPTPPRKRFRL